MAGAFQGDDYHAQFDQLAACGQDVHGEATFVRAYSPTSVLDAGRGTGRVAIELARHGVEVVGTDIDDSMLAQRLARDIEWVQSDPCELELGRTFDLVVMAGNVPLLTPPGTWAALVRGSGGHVAPGGLLVSGLNLGRNYSLDRHPWIDGGDHAVSAPGGNDKHDDCVLTRFSRSPHLRSLATGHRRRVGRRPGTEEVAVQILIVNFTLDGLSEEDFASSCEELAPAFAAVPGLVSKVWLADCAEGIFGGVYTFDSDKAVDDYLRSDLFAGIGSTPGLVNMSVRRFGILEGPTRVTRGLAQPAGV